MESDISDLRSQLIEEAKSRMPTPAGKDESTANLLAEDMGCTRRIAATILMEMVEDGAATVRKNGPNGQHVYKMK